VTITPKSCWLLYRVADHPDCSVDEVAERVKAAPAMIEPGLQGLIEAGLIAWDDRRDGSRAGRLRLTAAGADAVDRLTAARRAGLTELLDGWDVAAHPEIAAMVSELAAALLADDEKLLADARLVPVTQA
jgi:DNA-binding MarR family transcriptional regulator